jgi:prevent-host-death family protein
MPISHLRRKARQVLEILQKEGDDIYVTHYGRPVAAMVDYERFEGLVARMERPAVAKDYEEALAWSPNLGLADVTRSVARQAAQLRARHNSEARRPLIPLALKTGNARLLPPTLVVNYPRVTRDPQPPGPRPPPSARMALPARNLRKKGRHDSQRLPRSQEPLRRMALSEGRS